MFVGIILGVVLGLLPLLALLAACHVMSVRDRAITPREAYFGAFRDNHSCREEELEPAILREARKVVQDRFAVTQVAIDRQAEGMTA
jgi:hypothetical protein